MTELQIKEALSCLQFMTIYLGVIAGIMVGNILAGIVF